MFIAKQVSLFAIALSAFVSAMHPAFAQADQISVTVNGRSYSCGEGGAGGGRVRYYCECLKTYTWSNGRIDLEFLYRKADVETGKIETIRKIDSWSSWVAEDALKACEQQMRTNGLCHGRP